MNPQPRIDFKFVYNVVVVQSNEGISLAQAKQRSSGFVGFDDYKRYKYQFSYHLMMITLACLVLFLLIYNHPM